MTVFPHQLLHADNKTLLKKRQVGNCTLLNRYIRNVIKYFVTITCRYIYLYNLLQLNSFIEKVDFLKEQQDGKANESEDVNIGNLAEYHYMPETYNECKDRFGIIFHDNLRVSCRTCIS